jgi:glycerol kinase
MGRTWSKEIWSSQISVAAEVIAKVGISGKEIAAIGITNQREDHYLGQRNQWTSYNAIVWQDRRTAKYCDELKAQGHADMIKKKTGLVLDAYFLVPVKWILDNVPGARKRKQGNSVWNCWHLANLEIDKRWKIHDWCLTQVEHYY